MKKNIFMLLALFMGITLSEAQTSKTEQLSQIRKLYDDAKKAIADNGKNGMAPLDIKILKNDGTAVDEDQVIDDTEELSFYFNKHRENAELDYPDASSCYFVIVNWTSNGHTSYREILFDPNEGYLLFSFMKAETHAGFVVESRYYYGADGKLIDQKHKIGGKEATANAHTWSSAESDKELADKYLSIFEMLMNSKKGVSTDAVMKVAADPARMKFIRDIYAKAKEKVSKNDKSELMHDLKIVIRDLSWGLPVTTDLRIYFEPPAVQTGTNYCYFISEHRHHNNMGADHYSEYLFKPGSHNLVFSYTRAVEEGEKYEWRYYYDDKGRCIEAKTNAVEQDNGSADKKIVKRYLELFEKLYK